MDKEIDVVTDKQYSRYGIMPVNLSAACNAARNFTMKDGVVKLSLENIDDLLSCVTGVLPKGSLLIPIT